MAKHPQKTAKNIQVGDMIALRHDMKFNDDGISWFKDENGDWVSDTTTPLEPALRGYTPWIATYKTVIEKSVIKQGNYTVTIVTCEDGSTYEFNACNAYLVK